MSEANESNTSMPVGEASTTMSAATPSKPSVFGMLTGVPDIKPMLVRGVKRELFQENDGLAGLPLQLVYLPRQ